MAGAPPLTERNWYIYIYIYYFFIFQTDGDAAPEAEEPKKAEVLTLPLNL